MNRSTSPFAPAHPGVTLRCLKPCSSAKSANHLLFITSGTPYVVNIFSILSTAHCAEVVATNYTTGILEYWSHNAIAMWFPNGPAKSMLTFFHRPASSGVTCRVSLQHTGVTAWHGVQFRTILFTWVYLYQRSRRALKICFVRNYSLMSFMGNLHSLISKWHQNNNSFSSQNHPVYTCKFYEYILVSFVIHVIMIDPSIALDTRMAANLRLN